MPEFYAHSHPDFPEDPSKWEPLFTETCGTLHGQPCLDCEDAIWNAGLSTQFDKHHIVSGDMAYSKVCKL